MIGDRFDAAMISRMTDSETARTVASGSEMLNRKRAGSLTFQTTWKPMSTMLASVVSIRPAPSSLPEPEPIVSVRSVVVPTTS